MIIWVDWPGFTRISRIQCQIIIISLVLSLLCQLLSQRRNYHNGQDRHDPDLKFLQTAQDDGTVQSATKKNNRRPKMRKAGAQVLFWLRADGYVDINLINEVRMAGKASKQCKERGWKLEVKKNSQLCMSRRISFTLNGSGLEAKFCKRRLSFALYNSIFSPSISICLMLWVYHAIFSMSNYN